MTTLRTNSLSIMASTSLRTNSVSILALLTSCFSAGAQLWCTAYYPGWEQGGMPPSAIDFSVVTHVIQFSVVPNSSNLVRQTHLAGRKALICVGGADSQAGFQGASSPANHGAFITNLVSF